MPILVFPNWKELHVHVYALSIASSSFLYQPREGELDHPFEFEINKMSTIEHNYTTT